MLTILFFVLMAVIFGRLAYFAIRLAWGFTRVLFTLIFLPLMFVGAILGGLIRLAFPLLIIVGIISLIKVR